MALKIIQFTSGQVVMGDYTDGVLYKPFILDYVKYSDTEKAVLALAPFVLFSKDFKLNVNVNNVVWTADVTEALEKDYNNALENMSKPADEQVAEE